MSEEIVASQVSSDGNFEAALEKAAGAESSTASPEASSDQTTEAAVSPPADPSATATTPDREPFIPRPRFDEVNTRREQAEAELEQLAWAKQLDRSVLQEAQRIGQLYTQDRPRFIHELLADPTHGPALRAQLMQSVREQQSTDTEPQPDRQAEDGTLLYSAPQQAKWAEWRERKLMAQVTEKLQPLEQYRQQSEHAVKAAQMEHAAHQEASALIAEAKAWPGFEAHRSEIRAAMEADPRLSLERAYIKVASAKLPQEAEAKVVAHFKEKATAATGKPAAAPTAPKKYNGNFEKALEDAYSAANSR